MITSKELQNIIDQVNVLFNGFREELDKIKNELKELKDKKCNANKKS